mmetsp:Transcript_27969/g.50984  ORF Transcript_27969/g.50984 Transcript_27969/m.50984 type:complete len:334 (-) Transcript_27969:267-1268(-)
MIQRNNRLLLPSSPPLIFLACIVIIVSSAFAFSPSSKKRHTPTRIKDSSTSLHHSIKQRLTFNSPPPIRGHGKEPPKLILISGCPGTGKSTFGMSLALEQGILKCISTDTVRAVMRSYVPGSISPPLHRSSYDSNSDDGTDDPVKSWLETCRVLDSSVEGLVDDAIERGVSLVLEGVNLEPSQKYIDKFIASGGTACGVLLVVSNEEVHKNLLLKRGFMTGNTGAEEKKLESFDRVRLIQEEMIRSAKASGWMMIEQRVDPDPLDVVADELFKVSACVMQDVLMDELEEDCMLPTKNNNSGGELRKSIEDLVRAEKEDLEAASLEDSKEEIEI